MNTSVFSKFVALSVTAAICVIQPASGFAQSTYNILGVGTKSCATWTDIRTKVKSDNMENAQTAEELAAILKDNYAQAEYLQWFDGFVTAYNDYVAPKGDVTRGTDVDGMAAWLDTYCATNPLDNLAFASRRLIAELRAHPR